MRQNTIKMDTMKTIKLLGMAFSLIACAGQVQAWSYDRAERWEGYFQLQYQFDEDISGQRGSSLEISDDLGWGFGFGYNFSSHLNLSFNFASIRNNYRATIVNQDDNSDTQSFRHTADYYSFQFNGQYNLLKGAFTPLGV